MVAPNFLMILVNSLLLLFYSCFAVSSSKPHYRTHHKHHRHYHRVHRAPVKIQAAKPVATPTATPAQSNTNLINHVRSEAPKLNPKVLNLALHALQKAESQGIKHRDVMAIIDYSLASTEKRLWIIDLHAQHIISNTFVAHGKTTGDNLPQRFSNQPGSQASSIGLYVTKNTYFGNHGKSLRLQGLEPGFNSNALSRAIVIHGANYVSSAFAKAHGRLGRSWGCPAVPSNQSQSIVSQLKNGALVFAYFPDSKWLKQSKYLA